MSGDRARKAGERRLEERVRMDRALLAMLARRGESNFRVAQKAESAERAEAARRTPPRLRAVLYPEES